MAELDEPFLLDDLAALESAASNLQYENSPDILEKVFTFRVTLDQNLQNKRMAILLKEKMQLEIKERIAKVISDLVGELRRRGMASFSDHSPIALVRNCCQIEEIRWGAVILKKMFETPRDGQTEDDQAFVKGLEKYFDSISDNCKSLRYQFLDKNELGVLVSSATGTEHERGLQDIMLEAQHLLPVKITLDAWQDCAIPRKMFLRLHNQTPETLFADAPNKKCLICETAELTSESNFVVVDHCYHVFCHSCIEAKFVTAKNGYCPGCNMLVTAWASKEVVCQYLKEKEEAALKRGEGGVNYLQEEEECTKEQGSGRPIP